jgi:hypothetical protein
MKPVESARSKAGEDQTKISQVSRMIQNNTESTFKLIKPINLIRSPSKKNCAASVLKLT